MSSSLYHLTTELDDLERLFDQLDGDDPAAPLVLEQYLTVDGEWVARLEGCCEVRLRQIGKQAEFQARIDALQKALEAATKRQERIEHYMRRCLEARQLKRAEAGPYTVRIQGNSGIPPLLIDEAKLPAEWWRIPPPERDVPNKPSIRAALNCGREIPGAAIGERGSRLVIE